MKTLALILLLAFGSLTQAAHAQTQTIKGTIKDADSDFPLPGVNIVLQNSDPFIGGVTDASGQYRLSNVAPGRHTLIITYIGYKTQTIPNVLVTAGKETVVDVMLIESVEDLNEVVITADSDKDRPNNDMAKVSARTFSLEEVQRYSGGRNDVARLAANFAGVNAANDARNDIVVRGNSPTGLLWRIEGLPVATTNHFATLGTTGGPVSALNTNLLRTSDFLTGAFPAEYGNANAAVFDIRFRNGNTDKHEFTAQLSAFSGAEFMAEGPLSKKKQSSYLVSYRYGIAAVAATGTSAIPYYQDLSFKISLGESKLGKLDFFGLGATSSIDFIGADIDEDDLFADPDADAFFTNNLGVLGMTHTLRFGSQAYLKTTVGATRVASTYNQDNYFAATENYAAGKFRATEVEDTEMRYTVSSQYNRKFNARLNMRAGTVVEFYNINSSVRDRDSRIQIPDANNDGVPDYFLTTRDINQTSPLAQLYAQAEYKFTDDLSLTGGLHSQYFELTDDFAAGPRLALSWQLDARQRLTAAYGLHTQFAPFPVLLLESQTPTGEQVRSNIGLSFMKSNQFVVAYDRKLGTDWRVKVETYYQQLFDLPVEQFPSSYSAVNEGADFTFNERENLVSDGVGRNYGAEITIEKFFSKNYYALLTASVYESTYEGSDNVERNTAFNNNYVLNALVGKEFPFGLEKRNALTFDARFTTSGGRPYTTIDLEATRANAGRTVLREELAFSERYPYYLRADVKFGVRLNSAKGKVSHQFFVDLQNVTNRENIFIRQYNPVTDRIDDVNQIGFFPDFMYRIQF